MSGATVLAGMTLAFYCGLVAPYAVRVLRDRRARRRYTGSSCKVIDDALVVRWFAEMQRVENERRRNAPHFTRDPSPRRKDVVS